METLSLFIITNYDSLGVSLLTMVGLESLVATTKQEYVSTAVKLANDLPRLQQIRESLRTTMKQSALCDAASFTQNLESVYREMWMKYLNAQSSSTKLTWCYVGVDKTFFAMLSRSVQNGGSCQGSVKCLHGSSPFCVTSNTIHFVPTSITTTSPPIYLRNEWNNFPNAKVED